MLNTHFLLTKNFFFTFIDDNSSSEIIDDYDTDYLRQSLRQYGYPPGPLVRSTKQLYVRKLKQIMKDNKTELKNDHKIINNSNNIGIIIFFYLFSIKIKFEYHLYYFLFN